PGSYRPREPRWQSTFDPRAISAASADVYFPIVYGTDGPVVGQYGGLGLDGARDRRLARLLDDHLVAGDSAGGPNCRTLPARRRRVGARAMPHTATIRSGAAGRVPSARLIGFNLAKSASIRFNIMLGSMLDRVY